MLIHMADNIISNDPNNVCKLVEVKLERIVDSLLSAKHNDDNILLDVHQTIERIFIAAAMRIKNNNVTQAAKLLGINRNTLSKKLKDLNHNADED